MKVFETVSELKIWRRSLSENATVGFVPTMGALHDGHRSLMDRARAENDFSVLSIFVNPTQFNQASDLEKYPRTLSADLEIANSALVDAVFIPKDSKELYPDGFRYRVGEMDYSRVLCGEHRPGHFEGVLTVVLKLFEITRPTRAYFGEKDYQQLSLIEGMVKAFFIETEIVHCLTVRESDGLAMSSRNARLSEEDRKVAPRLHAVMTEIENLTDARKALEAEGFRLDYLEDRVTATGERRRFVAAFLDEVRLIDNVALLGKEKST